MVMTAIRQAGFDGCRGGRTQTRAGQPDVTKSPGTDIECNCQFAASRIEGVLKPVWRAMSEIPFPGIVSTGCQLADNRPIAIGENDPSSGKAFLDFSQQPFHERRCIHILFQPWSDVGDGLSDRWDGLVDISARDDAKRPGKCSKIGIEQQRAMMQEPSPMNALGVSGNFAAFDRQIADSFQACRNPHRLQKAHHGIQHLRECRPEPACIRPNERKIDIASVVVHGPAPAQAPDDGNPVFSNVGSIDLGPGILVSAHDDGAVALPQQEAVLPADCQQVLFGTQVESRRCAGTDQAEHRVFILSARHIDFLDSAIQIGKFDAFYCPVNQYIGRLALSGASYDCKNIHCIVLKKARSHIDDSALAAIRCLREAVDRCHIGQFH